MMNDRNCDSGHATGTATEPFRRNVAGGCVCVGGAAAASCSCPTAVFWLNRIYWSDRGFAGRTLAGPWALSHISPPSTVLLSVSHAHHRPVVCDACCSALMITAYRGRGRVPPASPIYTILHEHAGFVLVDKPPDVRIDGDQIPFPHTVLSFCKQQYPEASSFHFVNRIDYATSGIVCIAKDPRWAAALGRCFMDRSVRKFYLAIVHGHMPIGSRFLWQWPIGYDRSDPDKFKMAVDPTRNGRKAETAAFVLNTGYLQLPAAEGPGEGRQWPISKLLLLLNTGRRHQLRIHCREAGHPIVGDLTYSPEETEEHLQQVERMLLHAWRLYLPAIELQSQAKDSAISGLVQPSPGLQIVSPDRLSRYLDHDPAQAEALLSSVCGDDGLRKAGK